MKKLIVSENQRRLLWDTGEDFLWLGDTAWELFHRLNLGEIEMYFDSRRAKGFTVVQAVALAELDGVRTPNAGGERPLLGENPRQPNPRYFKFVDEVIHLAAQKELIIGLLPTWGDKVEMLAHGCGPVIFDAASARQYGEWIGRRYRDEPNIVWINGGDRSGGGANHAIWNALAEGIKSEDSNHLMTFHPAGGEQGRSSSEWFHKASWLDFNMAQSGHHNREFSNAEIVSVDYEKTPAKPCIDGEPRYEDHPVNWKPGELGWFDDSDARQAAYSAAFAGAFGHTYGCHPVWQMYAPGRNPISFARRPWPQALDLPGASQMRHLKQLLLSKPASRCPDQSLVASNENDNGNNSFQVRCLRDEANKYAWFYLPFGGAVSIAMEQLSANQLSASWYNPRNAQIHCGGQFPGTKPARFAAPSAGRGHDWVLLLEEAAC